MPSKTLILLTCIWILFGCKNTDKETNPQEVSKTEVVLKDSKPLYEDLEGNPIALGDYKGKRILLNYWATWCAPCIKEMPDLVVLQENLEKENYVFLFASDQSVKKIRDFKSELGFNFNFIKYNGAYVQQQIHALPVTLIFNEMGEQVARFDGGASWNTPEMVEQLKNIQ